jgi:protein phosphatase
MLARSIGTEPRVDVEMRIERLEGGDVLLLCTDGLWAPVSDEEIAATLGWPTRPEAIVAGLIGRALERGGPDNVTCVVVRIRAPWNARMGERFIDEW